MRKEGWACTFGVSSKRTSLVAVVSLQALGLQEALLDRVLMRVMILKEDVEYSRFKTKPFQLLMVTPEDYENSSQHQHQHHTSSSHAQQQLQQQHYHQVLRQVSAPPCHPVQQQSAADAGCNGGVRQPVSLQVPTDCRSASSSAAGAPVIAVPSGVAGASEALAGASESGHPPPGLDKDLMSRTQSAAGAVAVAAAARVSAAASALAAHMTNPQQLWHEKRGSTSGYSEWPRCCAC